MTRKFFFHSSISQVKTIVVYSAYLMIILCWLIPHVFESPLLLYRSQLMRFSTYFTFTVLIGAYLVQMVFFQFRNTVYGITENQLIKRTPVKIKTINFSEITSFRFLPFFGTGRVKTPTQTMYLSLIIDNLPELLESMERCLENAQRADSFDKKEIDAFKRYAHIAGFHLNHSTRIIMPLYYTIALWLFIGALPALFIWTVPLPAALIWIVCGIIFPCSGFLVATAIILWNVSLQLKRDGLINPGYDTSTVYLYTALVTILAYLVCGIIFKNTFSV